MIASDIKIECEEDGFHITIDGDSIDPEYQAGMYSWRIEDPEALYHAVRSTIGLWLEEGEAARGTSVRVTEEDLDAYEQGDPKRIALSEVLEGWDS